MSSIFANKSLGNMGGWQERHDSAIRVPKGFEAPIVRLIQAWDAYARAHDDRYESKIGDDGVLGVEWEKIGEALIGLLNGEAGRLDCGTLDGFIRDTIRENNGKLPE